MKLSARNQIKGKVVDVTKGATTSHVRIDIGDGVVITSSITNEASRTSRSKSATRRSPVSRRQTYLTLPAKRSANRSRRNALR
jgi:hypothetical protein